jgi:hypothetical protein
MIRTCLIFVVFAGCVLARPARAATTPTSRPVPKMVTVEDKAQGFRFKHPTAWQRTEAAIPRAVAFAAPIAGAHDTFAKSVTAAATTLPTVADLDVVEKSTLEHLQTLAPNLKVIEASDQKFAGHVAKRLTFLMTNNGVQSRTILTLMASNHKLYTFTSRTTYVTKRRYGRFWIRSRFSMTGLRPPLFPRQDLPAAFTATRISASYLLSRKGGRG